MQELLFSVPSDTPQGLLADEPLHSLPALHSLSALPSLNPLAGLQQQQQPEQQPQGQQPQRACAAEGGGQPASSTRGQAPAAGEMQPCLLPMAQHARLPEPPPLNPFCIAPGVHDWARTLPMPALQQGTAPAAAWPGATLAPVPAWPFALPTGGGLAGFPPFGVAGLTAAPAPHQLLPPPPLAPQRPPQGAVQSGGGTPFQSSHLPRQQPVQQGPGNAAMGSPHTAAASVAAAPAPAGARASEPRGSGSGTRAELLATMSELMELHREIAATTEVSAVLAAPAAPAGLVPIGSWHTRGWEGGQCKERWGEVGGRGQEGCMAASASPALVAFPARSTGWAASS